MIRRVLCSRKGNENVNSNMISLILIAVGMIFFSTLVFVGWGSLTSTSLDIETARSVPVLAGVINDVDKGGDQTGVFISKGTVVHTFTETSSDKPSLCNRKDITKSPKGCVCICSEEKGCSHQGLIDCFPLDYDLTKETVWTGAEDEEGKSQRFECDISLEEEGKKKKVDVVCG